MTQPSEMEIAKAREIVNNFGGYISKDIHIRIAMVNEISAALHDAAKVKAGCVRTDDGVERKIDGTLELTAEGHVLGDGCRVFSFVDGRVKQFMSSITATEITNYDCPDTAMPVSCYSTLEAAQRAKEATDAK